MTASREDPIEPVRKRRFPHHFGSEEYCVTGQPVGFTLRVGNAEFCLTDVDAVEGIVTAMDVAADAAGCHVIAWCVMPDAGYPTPT